MSDIPSTDSSYPKLTDSVDVLLDTHQGIVGIDLELCSNIINEEVSRRKPGVCGYCGKSERVDVFEKEEKGYIFINLCSKCKSNIQPDLEKLIEENSSLISKKYI